MLDLMDRKKNILLIGGGGHCVSCIDVIESNNQFTIVGIVDQSKSKDESILGYPILGTDEDLPKFRLKYDYAFVTIGHMKSNKARVKSFELLKSLEFKIPTIVSKTAIVSAHSSIDEGTIVMHHAIVNANSRVGKNCIINSKALIEHDNHVGSHCHISTNSTLNGSVRIGDNCFIGSNSKTVNNITIKNNIFVGIDSLVTKNLSEPGMYLGSPARKYK